MENCSLVYGFILNNLCHFGYFWGINVVLSSGCPRLLWLRPFHCDIGELMVGLVPLLLSIGLVITFGSLSHSLHKVQITLGVVATYWEECRSIFWVSDSRVNGVDCNYRILALT